MEIWLIVVLGFLFAPAIVVTAIVAVVMAILNFAFITSFLWALVTIPIRYLASK